MKKKEKGKHNPEKYIELNPYDDVKPTVKEATSKTAVVTFGRFNPPTIGHKKLVDKVLSVAKQENATPQIYMSHTQDKKKNPLSYDDKLYYAKKAFGTYVQKSSAKTIIQVAKDLSSSFASLILVVGQDRISEFETLLNKYNGKEYNYDSIRVISAGARDPDADDITGMSASKMRTLAMTGNFDLFKKGLPSTLRNDAENIYKDTREGMGLMEELDEERKPLTIAQRRKRGMVMRRYRSKLKMARAKAKRRMATPEKLKLRAQKKARGIIRDRLMKSKKYSEMSPSEKIAIDKRLLKIPATTISRIATRQLPIVRKAEIMRLSDLRKPKTEETDLNALFEQFMNEPAGPRTKKFKYLFTREGKVNYDKRLKMFRPKTQMSEDVLEEELINLLEAVESLFEDTDKKNPLNREHGTDSLVRILKKDTPGEELDEYRNYYTGLAKSTSAKRKAHFKKGAKMDDDNPAAYKPAPGDARAKTKPSVHTKEYDKQFKKEDYELDESGQIAGIKKKAEETGISYGILKQVFDRGLAAWGTGHRPGTTPTQWAYARINSFATGGKTRTTADADLWAKHKGKNEEVENNVYFDLNERFELQFLGESDLLDKILGKIHQHVSKGANLMDVVWEISNLTGVSFGSKELLKNYMDRYGIPKQNQKVVDHSKLLKKYGFQEDIE